MKRFLDIALSLSGLIMLSPVLVICMLLIWLQDFHSPLYIASRVGRNRKIFKMIKLRSMIFNADKTGVDSTAVSDTRITWIGGLIRRYKIDELSQLWNVFKGDMSLVGPRPQIERDVKIYTREEFTLLNVRPGITDLASIVFSDEGEILEGSEDPDLRYNQIIRPWKSRLGILYVRGHNTFLDIYIIGLTIVAILSKRHALLGVQKILIKFHADPELLNVAKRKEPLKPHPPPGSDVIVLSRKTP